MNGSQGIVPTVDLATNNTYPYPVMYGNSGFGNGFFGGDGIWAIVLIALLFGNGGWGGFGGFGSERTVRHPHRLSGGGGLYAPARRTSASATRRGIDPSVPAHREPRSVRP